MLTNQQLLDLLVQFPPEDLSLEQLEILRDRLRADPDFTRLLVDELAMGEYVQAALVRVGTDLQSVQQAHAAKKKPANGFGWSTGISLVLLLAVILSVALWWRSQTSDKPLAEASTTTEPRAEDEHPTDENAPPDSPPKIVAPAEENHSDETIPPQPGPDEPKSAQPTQDSPAAENKDDGNPKPWDAALKQEQIPPFTEVALQDFDFQRFVPRGKDLKEWFTKTNQGHFNVRDSDSRYGKCAQFDGLARLECPWPEDSALKFSLESYNRLRIHLFKGLRGMTLIYHEDHQGRWLGYATTREPDRPTPATYALTAADDYRNIRTEIWHGGPYELRYLNGELILSRGDIVLLRAPFEGPPEDVFWEGEAKIYGLALVRSRDFPPREETLPTLANVPPPAEFDWQPRQPNAPQPERLADGSLRYAVENPLEERREIFAKLPGNGLRAVDIEIEDFTAGAGVYLGREKGDTSAYFRFLNNNRMKQLQLHHRGWDDEINGEDRWVNERPTSAVAGNKVWVRLTAGLGNMTWRLSTDGVHWGTADFAYDWLPNDAATIGLQLVGKHKCGLTIKSIRARPFTGIRDLVEQELQDRAFTVNNANDMNQWREKIAVQKPEDISQIDWERGCAIRSLDGGIPRQVAYPLVELVLDEAVRRKMPSEKIIAALDDVSILATEYRNHASFQKGIAQRYFELPLDYPDADFAAIWKHWQEVPLNSDGVERFSQLPIFLMELKQEMLQGLTLEPGPKTRHFVDRAKFFHLDNYEPLVNWAEHQAQRGQEQTSRVVVGKTVRDSWHHPLVEELSRETYNFVSELAAVLESDATDDAATLITRMNFAELPGLTPAQQDPHLLISAKVALTKVMEEQPQLKQTLIARFDRLAALRQQAAASNNDASTMQEVAFVFAGTSASSAAYKWLGDRALVEGWFATAIGCYDHALDNASSVLESEILPRRRLAGALCGREIGEPVQHSVSVGTLSLSAGEFEQLVRESREQALHSGAGITTFTSAEPLGQVPEPKGYQPVQHDPLDGPSGDRHNEEGARHVNHFQIDWVDRQLAGAVEGDRVYVSNRFQLASYKLDSGGREWRTQPNGMKNQRAQTRALIPARPLVLPDRILVRHLYGENFGLMAVNKADGKLLWATETKENEPIVSDPFWLQGKVILLTGISDEQNFRLLWTQIDPETGIVVDQTELCRLRRSWLQRPSAEVLTLDDGAIVVLGGCVAACDAAGNINWLRQEIITPDEEDRQWVLQHFQRPIVVGQQLFVTQPGVRSIVCLNKQTGQNIWTTVLATITGLLGEDHGRLVVTTEEGLAAVDAQTGAIVWRADVPEMHPARLLSDGKLLTLERERIEPGKDPRRNFLVWRDTATGEQIAKAPLAGLDRKDPRMGLLIPHNDRLWTFFGENQNDPNRRFFELVPKDDAELIKP